MWRISAVWWYTLGACSVVTSYYQAMAIPRLGAEFYWADWSSFFKGTSLHVGCYELLYQMDQSGSFIIWHIKRWLSSLQSILFIGSVFLRLWQRIEDHHLYQRRCVNLSNLHLHIMIRPMVRLNLVIKSWLSLLSYPENFEFQDVIKIKIKTNNFLIVFKIFQHLFSLQGILYKKINIGCFL